MLIFNHFLAIAHVHWLLFTVSLAHFTKPLKYLSPKKSNFGLVCWQHACCHETSLLCGSRFFNERFWYFITMHNNFTGDHILFIELWTLQKTTWLHRLVKESKAHIIVGFFFLFFLLLLLLLLCSSSSAISATTTTTSTGSSCYCTTYTGSILHTCI